MSQTVKAANAHTVVATGWTNPSNCYSTTTDSTYATIVTAKNSTLSGDFGFPAFTTGDIPDHATITSVIFRTTYGLTATATGALVGLQARRNTGGVTLGSEITRALASMADDNGTATGATLTDLRTANELRVRGRGTKGNSSSASTAQIDRLYLEVNWTETLSGAGGTISLTATLTPAGSKQGKGAGSLALTATLLATGVVYSSARSGSGSMTLSATLSAAGTKADAGVGSITLAGTLAAAGKKADAGTGSLAVSATLNRTGQKKGIGTGTLTASANLAHVGLKQGKGAGGAVALTAALAATGTRSEGGESHSGAGSLAASVVLAMLGKKATPAPAGMLSLAAMLNGGGPKAGRGVGALALAAALAGGGVTGLANVSSGLPSLIAFAQTVAPYVTSAPPSGPTVAVHPRGGPRIT